MVYVNLVFRFFNFFFLKKKNCGFIFRDLQDVSKSDSSDEDKDSNVKSLGIFSDLEFFLEDDLLMVIQVNYFEFKICIFFWNI